ncbi:hypothetical protein [uncultured Microbacterium sp.]|uniref:hypothetical protein n=1 Tax=uncultured Microbacterium sp. TaxID=191216 RepID=UPI0025CEC505|nr:hypothetical protein [uncultured Microbacterium sp.]
MKSTHVYKAFLIGTPDRQLGLRTGAITLDDTSAPHVSARIDLSIPDATLLGLLDPRDRKRIRIEATATFAFGTQTRTFNLGIRDRRVSHRAAVASLTLASDEALLEDWAPLSDNVAPYSYQASVRALVNYVLGRVLPGTTLAAGGPDVPFRAVIGSTNLVRNPRARDNLTDWSSGNSVSRITSGGPAGRPTYVNVMASAASSLLVIYSADGVALQAGKRYRLSVDQNADAGTMLGFDGLVADANGNVILDLPETPRAASGGWDRNSMTFTAPANATKMFLRSFTTQSVAAGRSLNTTGWRVSEVTDDFTDTDYFDAHYATTAEYSYGYNGAVSVRTPLIDRASDVLTWRAGVSALEFLRSIVQSLGMRLVCDEARVFTLRDGSYVAAGSLTIRHAVNLYDGTDAVSREDTEYFDAAVVRYRWRDTAGNQQERVDSFALTGSPSQVRVIERNAPYPGPGFAEYAVRRAQTRGRQITATTAADWNARAEQPSEFTLLGAPVQLGMASRVEFDLDTDQMTVTSRTTDTVVGAIDLLPDVVINALPDVTINNL